MFGFKKLFSSKTPSYFYCIDNDMIHVFKEKLAKGDDINERAKTQKNETVLMHAVQADAIWIDLVLSAKPDINAVNAFGSTALMTAAEYGKMHAVQELIKNGADININGLFHNSNCTPS